MPDTLDQVHTLDDMAADASKQYCKIRGYRPDGEGKRVDVDGRQAWFVASTLSVDRHGTVILPEAFKANLSTYMSHPVFLAGHLTWSMQGQPTQIGTVREVQIKADRVEIAVVYARHDLAEAHWQIARDQSQTCAVSIGFRPIRSVRRAASEIAKQYPQLKAAIRKAGLAPDDEMRVYTEIELLEISQVSVPSNPHAVQRSIERSNSIDTEAVAQRVVELLGESVSQPIKAMGQRLSDIEYAISGGDADAEAMTRDTYTRDDEPAGRRADDDDVGADSSDSVVRAIEDMIKKHKGK